MKYLIGCCIIACCAVFVSPAYAWHPAVNCVTENKDGSITAKFDWFGDGNVWTIAAGNTGNTTLTSCKRNSSATSSGNCRNFFTPDPKNRHQPTVFPAGNQKDFFTTTFTGPSLSWRVGPATATATKNSKKCVVLPPPPVDCSDIKKGVTTVADKTPVNGQFCVRFTTTQCAQNVGLASYYEFGKFSDITILQQVLFDHKVTRLEVNSSTTLCIGVPTCASQIDWFAGAVITRFTNVPRVRYGSRLFGALHTDKQGAAYCTNDCAGQPNGAVQIDGCGVCGGDNSSCKDCAGVIKGTSVKDECGVCGGDNSSCKGCDGIVNSGAIADGCGVCGGDNSSCKDCAGVINGVLVIDACGKCGGDNSSCKDCAGDPNGTSVVDDCGACNQPKSPLYNKTCLGCDNVPNSEKIVDACNVCGGDNSSCKGCDGLPNSGKTVDACGVCDGQNAVCVVGCDGVPNSGLVVDDCGVCGGDSSSCRCELHVVKIDKSELIKKAKVLYSDRAVKYFNRATQCNRKLRKTNSVLIQKDLRILQEYITIVNSIPDQVEVCPGQCVEVVITRQLNRLRVLNRFLYRYASRAQHGARKACRTKGRGNNSTLRLTQSLDKDIRECKDANKICR